MSTINLTDNYRVTAGDVVTIDATGESYVYSLGYSTFTQGQAIAFFVMGTLTITDAQAGGGPIAIHDTNASALTTLWITQSGDFSLTASGASSVATGYTNAGSGGPFTFINDGSFSISGVSGANGILLNGTAGSVINNGNFTVTATASGAALGFRAYGVNSVSNTGTITVTGSTEADAIAIYGPAGSFTNSGAITASSSVSYGIVLQTAYSSTGFVEITNTSTGTITAQTAITSRNDSSTSAAIHLSNAGIINGAVSLGAGPSTTSANAGQSASQIVNTGTINGNITLSTNGNDTYDGRGGTLNGLLYLGNGTNTVYLGNDGETVFAGNGTATIHGGAGADIFTGGTGNSIIYGGGGADTFQSGAGADIFVLTPAAGAVSIFGFQDSQGDKIDLNSFYRFTSLSQVTSVAQEVGGNMVIDFGGGSTVTVYGVDKNALTASDFVFTSSTILVGGSDSIVTDASLNLSLTSGNLVKFTDYSNGLLTNNGVLTLTVSSGSTVGVTTAGEPDPSARFVNNGTLSVTGPGAIGVNYATTTNTGTVSVTGTTSAQVVGAAGDMVNSGSVAVQGVGATYGLYDYNGWFLGSIFQNQSGGTMSVTSSAGAAYGVVLVYGHDFENAGVITVSAATAGEGVFYEGASSTNTVTNSGTISVAGATTTGVYVTTYYGVPAIAFQNSGTITAQTAISYSATAANITNTGTGVINGDILLTAANDTLTNAGAINGSVNMGAGADTLDSHAGTITGVVTLGAGSNTATLGAENNTVALAVGTHVVDGGGGTNTVSYANAASGVAVSLALQGQAQSTGVGTDTLSNFQALIGSSHNDILTAGSGASTLAGGLGADTFKILPGSTAVTIADFSHAQGDKIDVSSWIALNSLADVQGHAQQSGSNTVITVGSNVLTLNNVTATNLTAADFIFEGSYQPILVTSAYAIAANQSLVFSGSNGGLGAYDLTGSPTLNVQGAVLVQGGILGDYLVGVHTEGAGTPTLHIALGGSLTVTNGNPFGAAIGFATGAVQGRANFTNDGTLSVTGPGASGVGLNGGGQFVNAGTITVTGVSGVGITGGQGVFIGAAAAVINSGSLTVSGDTVVGDNLSNVGFTLTNFGGGVLTNSGTINVTNATGQAWGIQLGGASGGVETVVNTGAITATDAIGMAQPNFLYSVDLVLANSGTINGAILLGSGTAQSIANTGHINGAVTFGTGTESYDGRGGTLSGVLTLGSGSDTVYLGADGETVHGGTGTAVIHGGTGNDAISGGAGSDTVDGGGGSDTLDGGGGVNTASFASASSGVTVSLALQGSGQATGAGTDTLSNFQNLTGSAFSDTLTGDGNNNVLDGGAGGNDVLDGGGGVNTVTFATAGAGVSVSLSLQGSAQNAGGGRTVTLSHVHNLTGSAFNDTLEGDANGNTLDGGTGSNTVSYAHAGAGVTVSLALQGQAQNTVGAGTDTLSDFQNLTGSAFNDRLEGDSGDNVVDGAGGMNTISYAHAGAGVMVSLALQGQIQNTIGAGTDTLANFQALIGSAFDDRLEGGGSAVSTLTGSLGADTFVYRSGDGSVSVTDFSEAQGDKINLSSLFHTFGQVAAAATQVGADVVIATPGGGSLTLEGVALSALSAANFTGLTTVTGDFLGTGHASLFWQNAVNNLTSAWLLTDAAPASGMSLPAATGWQTDDVGNFSGGAYGGDFLLRNTTTGAVQIWQDNAGTMVSHDVDKATLDWQIMGALDFNGDGKSDILWRNEQNGYVSVWQMDGTSVSTTYNPGVVGLQWKLVGANDFVGDGKAEVLWRDQGTGEVNMWTIDGPGAGQTHGETVAHLGAEWNVVGTGDFNGDGKADVLWFDTVTGQVVVWEMNGPTVLAAQSIGDPGPQWRVVDVADISGDGKADILWRDTGTGQVVAWAMNGFNVDHYGVLATVDNTWKVINHHYDLA